MPLLLVAALLLAPLVGACGRAAPAASDEATRTAAVPDAEEGCAERIIVTESAPQDAYDRVVAAFSARGTASAEEAWAKRLPTLLLFTTSW